MMEYHRGKLTECGYIIKKLEEMGKKMDLMEIRAKALKKFQEGETGEFTWIKAREVTEKMNESTGDKRWKAIEMFGTVGVGISGS